MGSKRALLILSLILVVLALIGGALVKKRKEELSKLPPPKTYPVPVEYAVVKKGTVYPEFRFVGQVEPISYAKVSTKVSGTILKLYKREGDFARKGELLLEVDPGEIEKNLSSLKAQEEAVRKVAQGIKAKIEAARVALKNAKEEYQRELFLYRNKAVPKEAVERAENAYHRSLAELKSLKAELNRNLLTADSIKKKREALSENLKYAKVRALKDCVVSKVMAYEGELALAGKPILELFYLEGLRVLVKVPPEVAKEVPLGSRATVEGVEARVEKIYPGADEKTHLYSLEIRPTGKASFRPRELVKLTLRGKPVKGELLPATSILNLKGKRVVLLIEGNRVKPVEVKVIKEFEDKVVIEPSLPEGSKVAVGMESKLLKLLRLRKVVPVEEVNG
jgi:RND family efflux transporter MFP subunit